MRTTRRRNAPKRGALGVVLLTSGMFLGAADGVAAVECGDVLTATEQLDQDLICTTDPALTLSGGQLDLEGHSVVCDGTLVGIVLEGEGGELSDGAVVGCQLAVAVRGVGSHSVARVTVSVADRDPEDEAGAEGIRVEAESDRNLLLYNRVLLGGTNAIRINGASNRVVGNAVSGSERGIRVDGTDNLIARNAIGGVAEGIEVRGERNQIRNNQIAGALDQGVELRGDNNTVVDNLTLNAVADGVSIFSSGNEVRGNGVFDNADEGIIVVETATSNRVVDNSAFGNGTDLVDQNLNCADNVWTDNAFETADPDDCID